MSRQRVAVVTGASSGIGAATAERLARAGMHVIAGARRVDRLQALASQTPGIEPRVLDVTDDESVAQFVRDIDVCDVLVNNVGAAFDLASIAEGDPDTWHRTFDVNVVGTLRITRALLPTLVASGQRQATSNIIFMGSTAGHIVYEGGGSYSTAKHGVAVMAGTLRLELVGQPVRVTEIAPGMVLTEEFSLNRFGGDAERAGAIYSGVDGPLTAEDIAECVAWVVERPAHVNIDLLVVRPLAQAAQHKTHRGPIGS